MFSTVLSPQVTYFIQELPSWQQPLLARLRNLLLNSAPHMEERFKYQIPFYHCAGALCYLYPQKDHVYLAFLEGIHLSNTQDLFSVPDTKQVRKVKIYPDQHFPEQALQEMLQEAILFNEWKSRKKKDLSSKIPNSEF